MGDIQVSNVIDENLEELSSLSARYRELVERHSALVEELNSGKAKCSDVVTLRSDLRRVSSRIVYLLSLMHRTAVSASVV